MSDESRKNSDDHKQEKRFIRRPFATGSKPGPDELDHFLELIGYYRKHVARDASSLFRVISEQVFDIQNYHDKVRQDCATFMELHIKDYANEVDKNFYNYVSNLRRSRTYGTLLELRVIARMYKRNVVLFEPNQNMETISRDFIKDEEYNDKEPIRVFYSHKDKHFDTIYTMETVEQLAESQAIVYEILYKDVFKLPDVKYAVERMLHDQDEHTTLPLEDDPSKYSIANGEIYNFDSEENTNCVLKDPRTCHFHNQVDFEEVVNENKDAITIINRSDDPGKLKIFKPIDGFLYNKEKSCVRQLLDEKITPFPYKVAKALDPSIYRNTEFELWSEIRKEQRLKWFDSNGLPLKENDDRYWNCYGDCEKNRRNEPFGLNKYQFETPIINEDSFITFDEDGKKKYYLVNSANEFNLSHLSHLTNSLDNFQPPRNDQVIMPINVSHNHRNNYRGNRRNRGFSHHNGGHMHGGHQISYVTDIERDNFQHSEQEQAYTQPQVYQELSQNYQYIQYDQNSPPNAVYSNQQQTQYQYIPQNAYPQPVTMPYQGQVVNYPYPPPTVIYPAAPQQQQNQQQAQQNDNSRDSMNLIRDAEYSSPVNWTPTESIDVNGNDLPMNDIQTLRFYYNLGVRYYLASGVSRRLENVVNQLESLELSQGNEQSVRSDPPPVPVNTPVSTRPPNIGHSGHRYNQHNNHSNNYHNNNNRRIFNQNNSQPAGTKENNKPRVQHNQQRKEIQFNSNVKNVHKVDTNKSVGTQVTAQNSNVSATSSSNAIERTSSALTATQSVISNPQLSPISSQETQQTNVTEQVQQISQVQAQPQYYQSYAPQNIIPQTPQPVYYYQMENGELMPVQAVQPQYYYTAPQTPLYYQPQQQQYLDGTLNSTDSGVIDVSTAYTYQQPAFQPQLIYQPSTPIYYPQAPLLPTPHVTTPQIAPVFPVNGTVAQNVQPTAVIQQDSLTANDTVTTGLNETSSTNNINTSN